MTLAVYSTNFVNCVYPAASVTYNVPAGYRAKLHDMSFWLRDDHPTALNIEILTVDLEVAGNRVWSIKGNAALAGVYQWHGGEVFESQLFFNAIGLFGFSFRANGILLTLP